jgi:hypothetical protein
VDDPPQAWLIAEPEAKQLVKIVEPEILQTPLRLRAEAIERDGMMLCKPCFRLIGRRAPGRKRLNPMAGA